MFGNFYNVIAHPSQIGNIQQTSSLSFTIVENSQGGIGTNATLPVLQRKENHYTYSQSYTQQTLEGLVEQYLCHKKLFQPQSCWLN